MAKIKLRLINRKMLLLLFNPLLKSSYTLGRLPRSRIGEDVSHLSLKPPTDSPDVVVV